MMKAFTTFVLKLFGAVMLTVMVMVTCLIFILVISPFINDALAKETADGLVDLPLPNDTEYMESVYCAGKLVGCGNGMNYYGAILIKSDLSLEDLREYYSGYAENEWECVVEDQIGSDIEMIEHEQLSFKTDVEGDEYYIVYTWGSHDNFFSFFDIRGY